jgi:hypothetical protein
VEARLSGPHNLAEFGATVSRGCAACSRVMFRGTIGKCCLEYTVWYRVPLSPANRPHKCRLNRKLKKNDRLGGHCVVHKSAISLLVHYLTSRQASGVSFVAYNCAEKPLHCQHPCQRPCKTALFVPFNFHAAHWCAAPAVLAIPISGRQLESGGHSRTATGRPRMRRPVSCYPWAVVKTIPRRKYHDAAVRTDHRGRAEPVARRRSSEETAGARLIMSTE